MSTSFFHDLLSSIADRGRALLDRSRATPTPSANISALTDELVSSRGEASGMALASDIVALYKSLPKGARLAFLTNLAQKLAPDPEKLSQAAVAYLEAPDPDALARLQRAAEPVRQEFFRRLNQADNGTAAIVAMRADTLALLPEHPELKPVEEDLRHLLASWFNRGFLVLKRIDWTTSAAILEKIIDYEAVHEITGWDDLRRRLDPVDRRCFAFFHPALSEEPLIFVQVALTQVMPAAIADLLGEREGGTGAVGRRPPKTATFYSISNCQDGLARISFGHFLIKQVVEELEHEVPTLTTFVTLSPVPGFADWLADVRRDTDSTILNGEERALLERLSYEGWWREERIAASLEPLMTALAARYLIMEKRPKGGPRDSVARFHLGNGALLERINWLADTSPNGLQSSHGIMVNYLYEPKTIERNHETYARSGTVMASKAVRSLLRSGDKQLSLVPAE